jgi:ribosomal protein L34E
MWDIKTACDNVLQHYIDERNKAPHCVICDAVLFQYQDDIFNYLYLLEVRDKKIYDMTCRIIQYMYEHYPYRDKNLHRHHISYKKDIQVPMCHSCHNKVHSTIGNPELDKWKPIDKKPKNQNSFATNLFKPFK